MRQQGYPPLPVMGRRGGPLPCSVQACYRTIRGRPPFELRWIWEHQIERAVDNAKRSDWDKWFRKQWYRAAAMRKWPRRQYNRWAQQLRDPYSAWRWSRWSRF